MDESGWVFKKEFLEDVRSPRFSKFTVKKEKENRFKTIWFMKDLSNVLRPPPKTGERKEEEADFDMRNLKVFWTACVFFHRFYVFHSFESQSRFPVAVACLFLASKVEEKPLRLSDHIYLYFRVRKNKVLKKTDPEFKDMERDVLLAERILLQTLNFDLNMTHPFQHFKHIIGRELKGWFADAEDSKQALRLATTLASDSLRSTLCLEHPTQQIALALVFLALTIMGLQPASNSSSGSSSMSNSLVGRAFSSSSSSSKLIETTWLDLFAKDIDESVLQSICTRLVEMYEDGSFSPEEKPYTCSPSDVTTSVQERVDLLRQGRSESHGAATGGNFLSTEESKGTCGEGAAESAAKNSAMPPPPPPPPPLPLLPPAPRSRPAIGGGTSSNGGGGALSSSSNGASLSPSAVRASFAQAQAQLLLQQQQLQGQVQGQGQGAAAAGTIGGGGGGGTFTPGYPLPPPDTPGSMASTPTFDNLPRPGDTSSAMLAEAAHHYSKKARIQY